MSGALGLQDQNPYAAMFPKPRLITRNPAMGPALLQGMSAANPYRTAVEAIPRYGSAGMNLTDRSAAWEENNRIQTANEEAARRRQEQEDAQLRANEATRAIIAEQLAKFGQGTPGKISLAEGAPVGGLSIGGKFAAENPYQLGTGLNTVVPAYTPAVEGDKVAALLGNLLGTPNASPELVNSGLGYLTGLMGPQEQPTNWAPFQAALSEWNPYKNVDSTKITEGMMKEAREWEATYGGKSAKELEALDALILQRLSSAGASDALRDLRNRTDPNRSSGTSATATGTIDWKALQGEYEKDIQAKTKPPAFQDWLRSEYGEPLVQEYNKSVAGGAVPSLSSQTGKNLGYKPTTDYTEQEWWDADRLVQEAPGVSGGTGSLRNALIDAYKVGSGVSNGVRAALLARYNQQHKDKPTTATYWYNLANGSTGR
jgi:hypothetical protein